jgi:hypothetical protein
VTLTVTAAFNLTCSPAHCGAAKGQLGTLKILKKYSADLWMESHRHDLPLHEAVQESI